MRESNDILKLRLLGVDSCYLEYINDRVQNISNNAKRTITALENVIAKDLAGNDIIRNVKFALLLNSVYATDTSIMLRELFRLSQVEVSTNE